jgi:hypothetical protein
MTPVPASAPASAAPTVRALRPLLDADSVVMTCSSPLARFLVLCLFSAGSAARAR